MRMKRIVNDQRDLIAVFVFLFSFILVFLVFPGSSMQTLLGLPLVLILPGYAFLAAIFHSPTHFELQQRIAISCVMSLTFITILSLGLNALGLLSQLIIVLSAFIFTVSCCIVAVYRRSNRIEGERVRQDQFPLQMNTRWNSIMPVSIAVIAVFLAVLGIYINLNSLERAPAATTAFYLLGDTGKAGEYPLRIVAGEPFPITIGIINNEGEQSTYWVQVQINDQNSVPLAMVVLNPGETWESKSYLSIDQTEGSEAFVRLFLFNDRDDEPYRSLHFKTQIVEKFFDD